jgi:hypothetical protein
MLKTPRNMTFIMSERRQGKSIICVYTCLRLRIRKDHEKTAVK